MALAPDASDARAWLREAARPHQRAVNRASLAVIADIVPAVATAAGLGLAIGALAAGQPARVLTGAALVLAGFLVRALLGRLAARLAAQAAAAVKTDVRDRILGRRLSSGVVSATAVTGAVEGVEALDGYWSRFAPARTAAVVSPLSAIAACAFASPVAAGVLAATLFTFVIGMALAGTAAAAESRRHFAAMERLSGLFLDRVRAMPAILAFQAEARTTREVEGASRELAARSLSVLRIAFMSSGVIEFFSALAVALTAVYCGFNLLGLLPFPVPEQLTLAQAFFVLALAPEVYAPMRRLAAAYHERQAAEAAVPLLEPLARPEPVARHATPLFFPPSLAFHHVETAYDGAVALRDFSLAVRPGETVALVGASGSGKTTILKILLGLAPLTGGRVDVDGHDLMRVGDLCASIAWAGQSPVFIEGSLAENIDLGRTGAPRRAIDRAARSAGLTVDLDRTMDERGGGLSGGERRRLALARALLKDAPVLLLDEPTAALDAVSEAELLPTIRQACKGRTCLIATHSEALAALADRVVRL